MKKKLRLMLGLFVIAFSIYAQDSIPSPDVYLNFNTNWFIDDNIINDNAVTVPNDAGPGLDAAWYNYNGNYPSPRGGFFADSGKFGGAAGFSGFKHICDNDPNWPDSPDNSPASAADALFLCGNNNEDGWDVIDSSAVWQGVREAFTIMYWWKSTRPWSDVGNDCISEDGAIPGWGGTEFQFDGGSYSAVSVFCYYNYYFLGYRSDSSDVLHKTDYFIPSNGIVPVKNDWVHVAITFDGSTGDLIFYLNGTPAVDWEEKTSNPNPIPTGYSSFAAAYYGESGGAVVFGAGNGRSPEGSNTNNFWGEAPQYKGKFGYIEDHYRIRGAAKGFVDEFAYWGNTALTETQIQTAMSKEIMPKTNTPQLTNDLFSVYPNPTSGNFTVNVVSDNEYKGTLEIYNTSGQVVYKTNVNTGRNNIDISNDLLSGLYLIKVSIGNTIGIQRLINR